MTWISIEQVKSLQAYLLDQHGGLTGIRDHGLLEAAIAAPLASFAGQRLYSTVPERAARLGFGLVSNHPFNDGNKRIGVMTMLVVLESNGYVITATIEDIISLGLGLADGTYQYEDALDWVNTHTRK